MIITLYHSYCNTTTNRVIYCGSFSKTIAPGLRLGYLVADWSVLSRILPYKTDGGTGGFEQMVIHEFCEKYFYSSALASLSPLSLVGVSELASDSTSPSATISSSSFIEALDVLT